uniref:Putative glycoside hydrolase n=1 Tax=Rhipicephalus pulchellus TaxID=72859 RepID=L7M124_RHIPC
MIPKIISAISICLVVGVCGATGPTLLNPHRARRNETRSGISSLNSTNLGLGLTTVRVSPNSAPRQPPRNTGAIRSGTSVAPGHTSSGLRLGSTPVSSNIGATANQGGTGTSPFGNSRTQVNPQSGAATAGATSPTEHASTVASTSSSPSLANRPTSPTQDQPIISAGHLVENATGASNRQPTESGSSGAPEPSHPTIPTVPVVGKPGSPPPSPLNKNTTRARPTSQRIVSRISSVVPLNDPRLVRQLPKRRNEGIYLFFNEQDVPFFPGPLNEPPLSVSVFRMHPGVPSRAPRLPSILRIRRA